MRTIAAAAIMAAIGATIVTSAADAAPKRRPAPPVSIPFFATAAFGEDVEILRHGPLTLFLQCRAEIGGEPRDIAGLTVVSTEDDMLITGERSILVPAGDDRSLFFGFVPAPDGGGYVTGDPQADPQSSDFNSTGGSAITPSGWVLTVPADAVGFSPL